MSKFKVPVIYDNDKHLPLPEGQQLDVSAIPLDGGDGNLLKATETGLRVEGSDANEAGPGIVIDEKVISVKLSKDTRALTFDSVGGLLVNADALVSPAGGNGIRMVDGLLFAEASLAPDKLAPPLYLDDKGNLAIKLDPDGPLVMTDKGLSIDMSKIACGVSSDDDNILSLGSDNKPYLPGDLGKL